VSTTFAVNPAGIGIRAGLTAGEYRVRMARSSANAAFDGHYRVSVSTASVSVIDAEPNDTAAEAQPLGPLPGSALGLLAQPITQDDDYYSFVLPEDLAAGEVLSIELHRIGLSPTAALRISLFDGSQAFVTSTDVGDPRLLTQAALPAGTYFVRVDGSFNSGFDSDYLVVVRAD
jgi:hypothetical protein